MESGGVRQNTLWRGCPAAESKWKSGSKVLQAFSGNICECWCMPWRARKWPHSAQRITQNCARWHTMMLAHMTKINLQSCSVQGEGED
jgi:hypothetical protein